MCARGTLPASGQYLPERGLLWSQNTDGEYPGHHDEFDIDVDGDQDGDEDYSEHQDGFDSSSDGDGQEEVRLVEHEGEEPSAQKESKSKAMSKEGIQNDHETVSEEQDDDHDTTSCPLENEKGCAVDEVEPAELPRAALDEKRVRGVLISWEVQPRKAAGHPLASVKRSSACNVGACDRPVLLSHQSKGLLNLIAKSKQVAAQELRKGHQERSGSPPKLVSRISAPSGKRIFSSTDLRGRARDTASCLDSVAETPPTVAADALWCESPSRKELLFDWPHRATPPGRPSCADAHGGPYSHTPEGARALGSTRMLERPVPLPPSSPSRSRELLACGLSNGRRIGCASTTLCAISFDTNDSGVSSSALIEAQAAKASSTPSQNVAGAKAEITRRRRLFVSKLLRRRNGAGQTRRQRPSPRLLVGSAHDRTSRTVHCPHGPRPCMQLPISSMTVDGDSGLGLLKRRRLGDCSSVLGSARRTNVFQRCSTELQFPEDRTVRVSIGASVRAGSASLRCLRGMPRPELLRLARQLERRFGNHE